MKKIINIVVAFCLTLTPGATGSLPMATSTTTNPVNTGWIEEEGVIRRALDIRATELNKRTGCGFKNDWRLTVSLEWSLGSYGGISTEGKYDAKTQTISFTVRTMNELNVRHKPTPLRLLDPKVLAEDERFGELADHELGHAITDQMSRSLGRGPFLTIEHFNQLTDEEQLGLNILDEGIATYFQHVRYPTEDRLAERAFPSTLEEAERCSYDLVVFQGGYWLVKDILSRYGKRGLEWLVTNPFIARENNMRKAAVEYRKKALDELGGRG